MLQLAKSELDPAVGRAQRVEKQAQGQAETWESSIQGLFLHNCSGMGVFS